MGVPTDLHVNDAFLFSGMKLSAELIQDLRRMNPWWENRPMRELPRTRRHLVGTIQRRLKARVAPIVVVRGPRQIGKTISHLQVLKDLLDSGLSPKRILHVQFDELKELTDISEPILRIVDWYEQSILGGSLNEAAQKGEATYLFFDEVQNLKNWAPQLKHLVDNSTTQVLVTGSSALRIEQGRDSLAGRISTIEAGVLSLTEIAEFHGLDKLRPFLDDNGLEPLLRIDFWKELKTHGERVKRVRDQAFKWFSDRGGYPLVHEKAQESWGLLADQLNENVIKRVIQHDLRVGERGRKRDAPLLEEVFRLACRYMGQAPSPAIFVKEAKGTLDANVGAQRIRQYLNFLGDTLLLRLIHPLEIRLRRKKGNVKICLADHGLRASWLQEVVPIYPEDLAGNPHLSTLAGHVAESVTGTALSTISSLDVAHLPERRNEPEIDFVLTIGTRRIPLEVKYQRSIDPARDIVPLQRFLNKKENHASFGLLVTQTETADIADDRIVALPLPALMLLR